MGSGGVWSLGGGGYGLQKKICAPSVKAMAAHETGTKQANKHQLHNGQWQGLWRDDEQSFVQIDEGQRLQGFIAHVQTVSRLDVTKL